MLKNTKSLETNDIPSWKIPHLGIFHETKLDVSKYDKDFINMSVSTLSIVCHSKFT